ncbi:MAG TPA: Ldh family oxidoreductase [Chthonomonadales bacterium]|nr:Ldh family oxidoreductase [Chthonomonadales bacterium]
MNLPPTNPAARIDADTLRNFVGTVFERTGAPAEYATFLADMLVANDLRGVFSHGTRQVAGYSRQFRDGQLNPDPQVRVVMETPTSVTVDGDGSLGYLPAYRAATMLCEKALAMGVAVGLTRNHGHIGAAGIYSRIPLQHDLFCYVTSGHQLNLQPGQPILSAAGGSPMSFAIPAGEEPPFVLDFGAMHDLYIHSQHTQEIIQKAPGLVFRCIGLGSVCQALGGFLAGVPVDPARAERKWPGANQGSFMIVVDLNLFLPIEQFKQEMDEYYRKVRQLTPLPGFDRAMLAGGPEYEREREYTAEGIPLSEQHVATLRQVARDFGLSAPV